jgi:hypothetical protein
MVSDTYFRFLPTSIISSLLEFFAALFALAKLILLISPPTFDISSPIKSVRDIRVVQAISIIVFVLMTMVPSAVPTSILGKKVQRTALAIFIDVLQATSSLCR